MLLRRATEACTTWPDARGWLECAWLLAVLAGLVLLIGIRSGFLRTEPAPLSLQGTLAVLVGSFFAPALAEELLFRVLLLPRANEGVTAIWGWALAALIAFVLYHPVKSWLLPARRAAPFAHPVFLLLTTLLGLACTIAYLRTGSLWPPVLLHWLFVAAWLLRWGGWRRMQGLPIRQATRHGPRPNEQACKGRH
jgi:predicted Abi (CAAX) family protease